MNTKRKNNSLKKFLLSCMLVITLISASFSGFGLLHISQVEAAFKQEVSLITNSDFSSYSSSSTPATPNSWTFSNPTSSEKIKNGVINVYPSEFVENAEDYELEASQNPGTTETGKTYDSDNAFYKHLMINSYEGYTHAYYTSSSFTLAKSSFYAINVFVKTQNNARASIYLKGLSDEDLTAEIENFTTLDEWEQYTIFISTNDFNTESVTLQLYLGGEEDTATSTGAVFFNKVNVIRYSASTYALEQYYAAIQSSAHARYINVELNGTVNSSPVLNANFEDTIAGDTNIIDGYQTLNNEIDDNENQVLKIVPIDATFNALLDTTNASIVNPHSNNAANNTRALFMYNKTSGYQGIESSDITLAKQTYYVLSVWVNSDCAEGNGATLKLVEKNPNADDPFDETEFTATTASLTAATTETTNETTNSWSKYSFYIEGHPTKETTVNLQLWLGLEDSLTTGYVFFDNITMQQISYSSYSSGSTASNSTTYSYNTDNNQFIIANGNFNLTNNEENEVIYPLTPRNWTLSIDDDNFDEDSSISGVVNTYNDDFNDMLTTLNASDNITKHVSISNPGLTPTLSVLSNTIYNTTNNVLLIGNPVVTDQTYTSESFSLSASSYYKVTFALNTQYTQYDSDSGVTISLYTSDYTIATNPNLNTNGIWKTYTVYIATLADLSVNMSIQFAGASGFVFLDDVEITTTTETIYNNALTSVNSANSFVNYNIENFDAYTPSDSAVNAPYLWTGTDNEGNTDGLFGILNTTKLPDNDYLDLSDPTPTDGNNVLVIGSYEDTFYTATNKIAYSLTSGNYYKITVKIKTLNIAQEESNIEYNEDDIAYKPGASIKLSSFDESFTGIDTLQLSGTNNNEWVEFVFYVSPTTTTSTNLEISLGNTNALTSGYVFVDSVSLESLELEDYTTAVNSIGNSKTILSLTELATDEEETEEGSEFTGAEFNWLLVSSLLFSIAIIIAVVGTLVRKVHIFKPRKRVKTSYDRRRTLEVEMNKRERIEFRRNIISDLKLEFDSIDKEIEEFLADNNARLEVIRQRAEDRKQHYQAVNNTILTQIANIKENFGSQISSAQDSAQKAKLAAKRDAQIRKLEEQQQKAKENSLRKEKHFEQLQLRRERYLQQQQYRKQMIAEEIARIEREIEEIAREEEKMWSEYRAAKEEAKKAKMEYYAQQRAEKRAKKEAGNKTVELTENQTIVPETVIEVDKKDTDTDGKK